MSEKVWIVSAVRFSQQRPFEVEGRCIKAFTRENIADACAFASSQGEEESNGKTWTTECIKTPCEIEAGTDNLYIEFFTAVQIPTGKAMMRFGEVRQWQDDTDVAGKSNPAEITLIGVPCMAYRAVSKIEVDRGKNWNPQ